MASETATDMSLLVFTHREADVVDDSIPQLLEAAAEHGVQLLAPAEEADKHPQLGPASEAAFDLGWETAVSTASAAIVLAGDGTLLKVLRELHDGPPVLGVNFGIVGYLSATPRTEIHDAVTTLANRTYDVIDMPSLEFSIDGSDFVALNDVVASGGATGRIIELCWRIIRGENDDDRRTMDTMGIVPCDGMVVATPVGSTAYNLSNGGPVVAWGVQGFVVSFIAPHTLTARPLVVAPTDAVEIEHMGRGARLKLFCDGQQVGELHPGEKLRVRAAARQARLAVPHNTSFYARYRDLFAVQTQRYEYPHHSKGSEV